MFNKMVKYNKEDNERRYYTLEFKAKIILYEALQRNENLSKNEKSYNSLAKKAQIDRRIITRWVNAKDKILAASNKRFSYKLKSDKEQCLCPKMEKMLENWINEQRSRNAIVLGMRIKSKAIQLYAQMHKCIDLNFG